MIFWAVLLIAAVIFAILRLLGLGIKFEPVFKVLATGVVVLPLVLLSALVVFIFEAGLCIVVLLVLNFTGIVHLSGIPADSSKHSA